MMETTDQELSKLILRAYPAPISLAWRHYLRASNKKEEHDRLLDLLEISAMFFAMVFLSQYRKDKNTIEEIDQELLKLSGASFGTWKALIQKISAVYNSNSKVTVVREIAQAFQKKEPNVHSIRFVKEICKLIGRDAPAQSKISPVDFLEWCVTYRNEIAHAKPSPSEEVCRARLEWLAPAVIQLLNTFQILAKYSFIYLQRTLIQNQDIIGEAVPLSGWDLENKTQIFPASPQVRSGNLYLCSPETNEVSLRLLPVFLYGKCSSCTYEPRVFIFRKADVKEEAKIPVLCKSVDYTCPVCGNRSRVEQADSAQAFLEVLYVASQDLEQPGEGQPSPETTLPPILTEVQEPESPLEVVPENVSQPDSVQFERKINPHIKSFLSLQSQEDNGGTRGLDEFGKDTYVETLLDTKLKQKILEGSVNLVILTGNAGDGKTAFIQQVENGALSLGANNIEQTEYGSRFILGDCKYQTIYDGSEDEASKINRQRLDEFFFEFRGDAPRPNKIVKIIAINEGHLREYLLNNGNYSWLGKQIHHFLEYYNFELDPSLLVINLNLRSVVDSSLASRNSIFDKLLDKFLLPKFWTECQSCSAHTTCSIKFNIDALTDKDYGNQVRSRIKSLYLISHLRSKQHITVRDLRASLAYILVNRYSCEGIHSDISNGNHSKFMSRYYYNSVFGVETEIGKGDHEQERVIKLLRQTDVASVPNPHLDNLLAFTHPISIGLFAEFSKRASPDINFLEEQFIAINEERLLELSQEYHSSMRRKFFFEGVESATSEAGYSSWMEMLPFKSFGEFMGAFTDTDTLEKVRNNVLDAINISERIYNNGITANNLCIRTNANSKSLIKAFSQFPKVEFRCIVKRAGKQGLYLEYCPNTIIFRYKDDQNKQIDLNLDLYELLVKIGNGYIPGGKELRDFFLNLLLFKKQLTALPASSILLTEDEKRYFRLRKSGNQVLSIEEIV